MGKLALAVLFALVAVHFANAVGQYPPRASPVRINPYVLKYLQGYYKKHKTLPPALKRWAYDQLQKRQQVGAAQPYQAQPAVAAPVAPQVYAPPALPVPAPVAAPVSGQPQAKAGPGYPPRMQSYAPRPTYSRPAVHSDPCHGRVNPGFCHGKYAGHYSFAGNSQCYIQCDQWGRAYGKPCAPGTYWRYGGPEPAYYNHCA